MAVAVGDGRWPAEAGEVGQAVSEGRWRVADSGGNVADSLRGALRERERERQQQGVTASGVGGNKQIKHGLLPCEIILFSYTCLGIRKENFC